MAYKMEQGVVTSHWHYDNLWGFKKWHLLHDVQKHPWPVVTHDMQGREKDWFGTHLANVEWSKVLWSWDGVLIFLSDHWFSHLDPWWYNWQDLTHHYNLKENHQIGLFMSIQAVYSCLFALIVEIKSNCDKGISQCPPLSEVWSKNNKGGLKQGKRRG